MTTAATKMKIFKMLAILLVVFGTTAIITPTTTSSYAQLAEDVPFIIEHVPLSDRISAMEKNDDVDVGAIDEKVREALDLLPR